VDTIQPQDIQGLNKKQPLLGCFRWERLELAAARYILHCHQENRWRPVTLAEHGWFFGELLERGLIALGPDEQYYPTKLFIEKCYWCSQGR
jgi:hypothetical protein